MISPDKLGRLDVPGHGGCKGFRHKIVIEVAIPKSPRTYRFVRIPTPSSLEHAPLTPTDIAGQIDIERLEQRTRSL